LASLSIRESNTLLEVGTRTARHAYVELHAGFHPGFYFAPDKDLLDPTVVMMSTDRFRSVEPEFEQCVSNLHHDNFEDVQVSKIHFDHDEEFTIFEEEETAFRGLFDYMQVDPSVREVVISGHADNTGAICYNDTLSSRRAW
jgi:outer membrane protein OmpA-like peptidoglycan-associated protein